MVALPAHLIWWVPTRSLTGFGVAEKCIPPSPLQVSAALSCELILSVQICCHTVFIFAHSGFGGIFCRGDNVAVLLDYVGESRCTRSLTLLLLDPWR